MANEKRLIDAYTLAEEIESLAITVAGKPAKWNDAKHSVLRILGEQPDVDAAEVVRCKDCIFASLNTSNGTFKCTTYNGMHRTVEAWEYCFYGERKDT